MSFEVLPVVKVVAGRHMLNDAERARPLTVGDRPLSGGPSAAGLSSPSGLSVGLTTTGRHTASGGSPGSSPRSQPARQPASQLVNRPRSSTERKEDCPALVVLPRHNRLSVLGNRLHHGHPSTKLLSLVVSPHSVRITGSGSVAQILPDSGA